MHYIILHATTEIPPPTLSALDKNLLDAQSDVGFFSRKAQSNI